MEYEAESFTASLLLTVIYFSVLIYLKSNV
jgi:hypothetical protein